jgi:hypothetical protein
MRVRPRFEMGLELEFEDQLEKGSGEFLLEILKN